MKCSLNCFLDFLEAPTSDKRQSVVNKYKREKAEEVKGMNTYYLPAIRAIKGTLCPGGTVDQTIAAVREASVRPKSTGKLNDARIQSNVRVYRAFRSAFGNRQIRVLPSPRMAFRGSSAVSINLQAELLFETDGRLFMLKMGLRRKPRASESVRTLLQMLYKASKTRGLELTPEQVNFLETTTGELSTEYEEDASLKKRLSSLCKDLADKWENS